MSKTRVVSIVSSGFSGSTLLDLILGSHPNTLSLGEVDKLDSFRNEADRVCSCGAVLGSCAFWSDILRQWDQHLVDTESGESTTDVAGISITGIANRIGYRLSLLSMVLFPIHRFPGVTRLISPLLHQRRARILELYDMVRSKSGSPILIDSSKSTHRFRLLHALRPDEIKAIHLTRDGRARLASNLKRVDGSESVADCVKVWRFGNLYALRLLKMVPESAYLHVRYEELCRQPEETIKKMCDFLEIPFNKEMLEFRSVDHHLVSGNRMRVGGASSITEDTKWRTTLTAEQLQLFEKMAGKLNRQLLGDFYVE